MAKDNIMSQLMTTVMRKIAYNSCFGGFGLSLEGMRRYAELTGLKLVTQSTQEYFAVMEFHYIQTKDGKELSDHELPRADPALIQVIEELGARANGQHACLAIRELPQGTSYRIDEYDGNESVMTIDDYDWQIA